MTEREQALEKREIFMAGATKAAAACFVWMPPSLISSLTQYAEGLYPLPKITRSRVVRIGGDFYRIRRGMVEVQSALADCCPHDVRWNVAESIPVSAIRALADLSERPNEEVDADESSPSLPGASS